MMARRITLKQARRNGFTLVEALISMSIAAIASSALYLGLTTTVHTAQYALEQTIATGIAEQVMDEVMGGAYVTGGDPLQAFLGPDAWEASGNHRERFNDIDDYTGIVASPPKDMHGITLGSEDGLGAMRHPNFRATSSFLANWSEEIDVYYVNEADTTQKVTTAPYSNLRAVEVRIYATARGEKRLLAQIRRIHGYVPSP